MFQHKKKKKWDKEKLQREKERGRERERDRKNIPKKYIYYLICKVYQKISLLRKN